MLNPPRISVKSQAARFHSGAAAFDQPPLWTVQWEWSIAGQAQLARPEALNVPADQPELRVWINAIRKELCKYLFSRAITARKCPGN